MSRSSQLCITPPLMKDITNVAFLRVVHYHLAISSTSHVHGENVNAGISLISPGDVKGRFSENNRISILLDS